MNDEIHYNKNTLSKGKILWCDQIPIWRDTNIYIIFKFINKSDWIDNDMIINEHKLAPCFE